MVIKIIKLIKIYKRKALNNLSYLIVYEKLFYYLTIRNNINQIFLCNYNIDIYTFIKIYIILFLKRYYQ